MRKDNDRGPNVPGGCKPNLQLILLIPFYLFKYYILRQR